LTSNLTEDKIDTLCADAKHNIDDICNLIKQNVNTSQTIYPMLFTLKLEQETASKSSEILEDKRLGECMEHRMWMLSLITMSWTLRNLKGKIEVGSCHNINHPHGSREPRMCNIGSEFHRDFYNDCIRSFENILRIAKENPPATIS
jgi:hypothetical protein